MTRLRRLTVLTALAACAACGTTVPVAQQVSTSGTTTQGSTSADTPSTDTSSPTGTTPTTATASGPGGAATTTQPGSSSTDANPVGPAHASSPISSGTSSSSTIPTKGRGWDSQYVYVGVTTQKDTNKAFSSVGYSGIDPGDTEAQANSVIARINAHGGLLGRKVKPVFKDVPLIESAGNPDQYGTEVCTFFSQDTPVVAVINIVLTMDTDNFRSCFAKAHIPLFNSELTATDQTDQAQFAGYLYTTIVPTWDAFAPVLVQRLQAQGYFQGWDVRLQKVSTTKPRVGVLVLDSPVGARTAKIIVKALKDRGYADVLTYSYAYPGNQIDGAISYFAGNGVTHVISSDIEVLTFQIHAAAQQYYPRYGINTNNNPLGLAMEGGAQSQVGAIGVGWEPAYDVTQSNDPGIWSSGEKACLDGFTAGKVSNKGRLAVAFGLAVCDGLELFAQGTLAGKAFTAPAIRAGIDAIGSRYSPAGTFASGIRAGRSFLPGGVRDLGWDKPCGCYKYTTRSTVAF